MPTDMEQLLHYVWLHRLFPTTALRTDDGRSVEIIDPGLHNHNAGPDFFNAKIKVDGTLWAGNVELHERSSDWYRHGHERNEAYNSVVLHVVTHIDRAVSTQSGRQLPQMAVSVPAEIASNYRELLEEETYPPCWRVIPRLTPLTIHSWMSALTAERLEEKTRRIDQLLELTGGDWEQTFFITLARNFGFGVNAEAFEQWALRIPPSAVGKHRDNLFQVEAFFFGQAGLLEDNAVEPEQRDAHFLALQQEYRFLAHKFSLTPMDAHQWRFLRMRPQNFPHIRLSQLASLYHSQKADFSHMMETADVDTLRGLLAATVTPYWETHYSFGAEAKSTGKTLRGSSLDLLLINTVAPLLFAYGRKRMDEARCERAFELLEQLKPERNFIIRSWEKAGLSVQNAADSQALIRLRRTYCDRKDCLRCRFGSEYLRKKAEASVSPRLSEIISHP